LGEGCLLHVQVVGIGKQDRSRFKNIKHSNRPLL
jgi:hypothetical protein